MKKLSFYVPFVCLLILFFSCKKSETDPTPQITKDLSFNKTSFATAVNQDTVPPSNAVDVKTYGATGNGSTDDTKALQNAINAQNVIVIKKGTYIINQALTMRSGVKIYGTGGAIIKSGSSISGKLLSQAMFINESGVNNTAIVNLRFQPGSKGYSLGAWANACINLTNSNLCDVKYNTFDFKQAYSKTGMEGVWLTATNNCYIGKNTFNTVGLVYEAGASSNLIVSNVINNSHDVAIGGYGNSNTFCKSNSLQNNTITNSGYMAIADTKNTDGTTITGNNISGTGKSNLYTDGFGISAIGVNAVISLNTLSDCQGEYMEIGGISQTVKNNTINDTKGIAEGMLVNFYGAASPYAKQKTAIIDHNTINGCFSAITVEGPDSPNVSITNNTMNNPWSYGVDINSNSSTYNVAVSGNTVWITKPSTQARVAFASYANSLTSKQILSLTNNLAQYQASANGGKSMEYSFLPRTNNVTLTGNRVVGNNIKAANSLVIAIAPNGARFTGYTITNNTFTGAFVDISGFALITQAIGNVF